MDLPDTTKEHIYILSEQDDCDLICQIVNGDESILL